MAEGRPGRRAPPPGARLEADPETDGARSAVDQKSESSGSYDGGSLFEAGSSATSGSGSGWRIASR